MYPQGIDQFQTLVGVLSKNASTLGLVHRQDSSQRALQKLRQGDAQTSRLGFGGLLLLFRQADLGSDHNDNDASYFVIIRPQWPCPKATEY